MADPRFFLTDGPFTLRQILAWTGASLTGTDAASDEIAGRIFSDVAPLDRARGDQISFFDNPKYLEQFRASGAGACFVKTKFAHHAPAGMLTLLTEDPYRCYAMTAQKFYPRKSPAPEISPHARIAKSATLGKGCRVEAGVVIGSGVKIGNHCVIAANSVIDDGVEIGDFCQIGACSTISHAVIGKRVILHRGVHIGQDGFGFAMAKAGHVKVPQLGRVIIDDEVEIGSGTCIDRGTGPDTVIGMGSKIDNLVQIGHNVQIGQGAIIVAQVGIAGSCRIGDNAVMGGQAGIAGHIKVGPGARIAAQSGVMEDVPGGASVGGSPAVPVKDWHRQTVTLGRLTRKPPRKDGAPHREKRGERKNGGEGETA